MNLTSQLRSGSSFRPDSVAEFAATLKKNVDVLLEQLRLAGIEKTRATDRLSESDKAKLLAYLKSQHGCASPERKRITLTKAARNASADSQKLEGAGKQKTGSIVVVGGLGRFDYELADGAGKELLDAYRQISETLASAFQCLASLDEKFREACRQMAETLKRLRETVKRAAPAFSGALKGMSHMERHGGAFFHTLKVDRRNLP